MVVFKPQCFNELDKTLRVFNNSDFPTKVDLDFAAKKLMLAFPDTDKSVIPILLDRITKRGFTKEQLIYAVNKVIDTHHYPRLVLADIICEDGKVQLYDANYVYEHRNNTAFKRIHIEGVKKPYFAKIDDLKEIFY